MIALLEVLLLAFLMVIAIAVTRLHDLFAAVVLTGIYSLLSASIFVVLDAVDVAFTEAAVGAGIATVIFLGALSLTERHEKVPSRPSWGALLTTLATGAILIYGTLDMPHYGDPNAPVHRHVAPRYIQDSPAEVGVPNMVTSVLASYRSYDTLGETTVIFTAGISALLLLRRRAHRTGEEEQ